MKRFKNWLIGDYLKATDDVFERSRIELTYGFTVFFIVLGLFFYGKLIADNYTWQIYITTYAILALPFVFIIIKKYKNINSAALFFVFQQLTMHLLNGWLLNFEINLLSCFWMIQLIIFTFVVLGLKWGMLIVFYDVIFIMFGIINSTSGFAYYYYPIPPEQQLPDEPLFIIVPIALITYALYMTVKTREIAEREINQQKKNLQHTNKEITDSINYAKRIQKAVLPLDEHFQKVHPNSFILFKPKDIVSGDFYWFHQINENESILICADCTGHGVPGAFMTVVGCNLLNNIIIENKVVDPSEILHTLDSHISITLKQDIQTGHDVPDGMDLSLLKIDKLKNEMIFCSAKRPAFYYKNNELIELKANKFSLGGIHRENKIFEEQKIIFNSGEKVYLFTDGYPDQFGGQSNKKFMTKRLKETLISNIHLDAKELKFALNETIENWKKPLNKNGSLLEYEQTDDIQVIGIHF